MRRPYVSIVIHHRHSTRLRDFDYSGVGAYFVTVCVGGHECLFGQIADCEMRLSGLGEIVQECWSAIPDHFSTVELAEFVVMPNHLHGVIVIHDVGATHASPSRRAGPAPLSLGAIIGSFKSAVAKRINAMRGTTGAPVWQRNYYEHIIRNEADYNRIAEYIEHNPMRWVEDSLHPDAAPATDRRP